MKRRIKIIVDILMFVLFLYLLSYRPGMGLMLHAVFGITLLSLFLVHHVLNLQWYRGLGRGTYPFRRILLTGLNFLLTIAMAGMMVSAVMLSGMVFSFSGIRMTQFWRQIHVTSSAWCFLLMAFHLGMHLHGVFLRLQRKARETAFEYVCYLLQLVIAIAGMLCFIRSGLWADMFMAAKQQMRPISGNLLYAELLVIVMAICILAHWLLFAVNKKKNRKAEIE